MDILFGTLSKGQEVEVLEKPQRRRFTLEYKRRIVREADGCGTPGDDSGARGFFFDSPQT